MFVFRAVSRSGPSDFAAVGGVFKPPPSSERALWQGLEAVRMYRKIRTFFCSCNTYQTTLCLLSFGVQAFTDPATPSGPFSRPRSHTHTRVQSAQIYALFPKQPSYRLIFSDFSPAAGMQTMLAPDVANMYPHKIPRSAILRNLRKTTRQTAFRRLSGRLPRPLVREICNQASNPSLRPTYREVTACGGTFPDTVTYLHGLHTLIGPTSFRETRSPQAAHLPEDGTL